MHRTAGYSQVEIVRLVNNFAYAKTLATQSKMNEHHDLFAFWVVNRISVGTRARDQNEFVSWIRQEIRFAQQKLKQAAAGGPEAFGRCLKSMRDATHSFFATYRDMEGETAVINENAANEMGLYARRAAQVQAAANVSLAWLGLLGGPATIGLSLTRAPITVVIGDVTWGFLGKKIAVGVVGAFGTNLVTDWSSALNAEFAVTQAATNAPGFVDDGWRLFFQTLNDSTHAKLQGVAREAMFNAAGKQEALYGPGMTVLGNPATERAVVERAAALKTMETADQQLANYKPAGQSFGSMVFKSCAKVAAWGLTIKSTYDSWSTLQTINKQTEPTKVRPYQAPVEKPRRFKP